MATGCSRRVLFYSISRNIKMPFFSILSKCVCFHITRDRQQCEEVESWLKIRSWFRFSRIESAWNKLLLTSYGDDSFLNFCNPIIDFVEERIDGGGDSAVGKMPTKFIIILIIKCKLGLFEAALSNENALKKKPCLLLSPSLSPFQHSINNW